MSRLATMFLVCATMSVPVFAWEKPRAPHRNPTVSIYLKARPNLKQDDSGKGSILLREIFRQALLIAARDGMGLGTRDATLRESAPDNSDTTVGRWDMTVLAVTGESVAITVRCNSGEKTGKLWDKEFAVNSEGPIDYLPLIAAAERVSREKLPAVLASAGLEENRKPRNTAGLLPNAVDFRLRSMTFTRQFEALRDVHGRIREDGESAALLGGLVRGYSNLGKLTEHFWSSCHKAFKARALLYAERMVVTGAGSPRALWHRAYARALAGFHAAALADIAAADKRRAGGSSAKSVDGRPDWVTLIEHYCRYQTSDLFEIAEADDAQAELADLLGFFTVENSKSSSFLMAGAHNVLERNAECFRVIDAACDDGGVTVQRYFSSLGPNTLSQTLPRRLRRMRGLPAGVKEVIAKHASREEGLGTGEEDVDSVIAALRNVPEIVARLVKAGGTDRDREPLSWEVLGRLIEDVMFVHLFRRVDLLANTWGVSADDFIEAALPLVKDHRYRAAIAIESAAASASRARRAEILSAVRFFDVDYPMYPLIRIMRKQTGRADEIGDTAHYAAWRHLDETAHDYERRIYYGKKTNRARYGRALHKLSPHSPVAIATRIENDWENVSKSAEKWGREFGHQPRVLAALGTQYSALRRFDDAERYWRKYVDLASDNWAYRRLAFVHLDKGDPVGWKRTLDEFLETEQIGLAHVRVREEIASYLMSKGKFEEARPYAETAAESWAGTAMIIAATCNEGLKNWERAELWIRRTSERYTGSAHLWYYWCVRTGRGDREAAAKLADDWVRARSADDVGLGWVERMGGIHLCGGRLAQAINCYQRVFDKGSNPGTGHYVVALADALGDKKKRGRALRAIAQKSPAYVSSSTDRVRQELIDLAALFEKCLAAGDVTSVDLDALESLWKNAPRGEQAHIAYFIGCFLDRRGKETAATQFLFRAAHDGIQTRHTVRLARDALRSRGAVTDDITPRVYPKKR